jgi:hypothetical protein
MFAAHASCAEQTPYVHLEFMRNLDDEKQVIAITKEKQSGELTHHKEQGGARRPRRRREAPASSCCLLWRRENNI